MNAIMQLGASPQEANQILNQVPMYWGDQPIVAAPAYIGAIIIFLAILALFLIKGKLKWWLVTGIILSLLLSWGKNFSILTDFFIEYIPLYNKFRAVSSIQVLLELLMPILAILGLQQFLFNSSIAFEKKKKILLYATAISAGTAVVFILFKSILFDFSSPYDSYFIKDLGPDFVDAMKDDRMTLFNNDAIRSLILIVLSAGVLWFFLKAKLKQETTIAIFALLILIDLVGVDRRYVNSDDFVVARVMTHPFQENFADKEIFFGPIMEYTDNHLSLLPDFISNCGIARVFAYLMEARITLPMVDKAIFDDTSTIIKKALQKTFEQRASKTKICSTAFEIALKQLI